MILPLKRYADFSGRSRRKEFWMWILFLAIVYGVIFTVITMSIDNQAYAGGGQGDAAAFAMIGRLGIFLFLIGIFWLATLMPAIAVQVRRLHDTDRSGWWLMLWAGPYLLGIIVTIATLSSGGAGVHGLSLVLTLAQLVGSIVLLVWFCLPGTAGPNRFGGDPLDPLGLADLEEVYK
jgi:uncharacterized membrane protein YhaH (DUF805 family)